ncbi:MAG: hypothetical protein AAF988_04740 [Pseudomonadota bacterium]
MFDTQAHGLYSHYNDTHKQLMRRLMLEDWKKSGVKLPTYMKLVARFIIPLNVPDEWLKKLSHQTMDKMLKRTSTPRYEFWACLHLYLIKKYSLTELRTAEEADIESLGHALSEFADNSRAPEAGHYSVSDGASLEIGEHACNARFFLSQRTVFVDKGTMPKHIT